MSGRISASWHVKVLRASGVLARLETFSGDDPEHNSFIAAQRVGRGFVNAVAHERSRRSISRSGDVEYDTTDAVVGVGMFVLWHVCSSCSWLTGLPTVGPALQQ